MNYASSQFIIGSLGAVTIAASFALSIGIVVNRASEAAMLRETLWRGAVDERLSRVFSAINDFPGSAGKDLLYLRTLKSEKQMRDFLESRSVYDEAYRFDEQSVCALAIFISKHSGLDCSLLPADVTEAVERAKMLASGEVYISPLVLHKQAPALLYGTRTDDDGTLVSVVHADYFLEEIRRLSREGESVFLLESDGSYLAHPDTSQEKYFDGGATFYRDFPEVPGDVLADTDVKRFETGKRIFTFWRVYPTESNFAVYEGASKIFGPEHGSQYFWVMTAVSEKPNVATGSSIPAIAGLLASYILIASLLYIALTRPVHSKSI